jgi:hypothetical protein
MGGAVIFRNPKRMTLAAAAALTVLGCGSSSSQPSTTATVGTAGATLKAGVATLSIPPNALSQNTAVTVREAEPKHANRTVRVEVEPHGQALAVAAKLSIQVNDQNVKVKMVDDNGGLNPVEAEDRNHHEFKTTMGQLGEVEVELEHGQTCATPCASGQECDDGACKAQTENANARTCDPVCDSGQECDDGTCKTHDAVESEHGGTAGTCNPPCATGMQCDATDSVCKVHGGNSGP